MGSNQEESLGGNGPIQPYVGGSCHGDYFEVYGDKVGSVWNFSHQMFDGYERVRREVN